MPDILSGTLSDSLPIDGHVVAQAQNLVRELVEEETGAPERLTSFAALRVYEHGEPSIRFRGATGRRMRFDAMYDTMEHTIELLSLKAPIRKKR